MATVAAVRLNFKKEANYLLVDTSYYVFYRYFATLRWYSFQQEKGDDGIRKSVECETIHENEAYMTAYKKHMKTEFAKLQKKWKVPSQNVLFCNDCPRVDIWRNTHYTDYKAGRVCAANFNGNIFGAFYNFLKEEQIKSVEAPNLEADDMVYIMSKIIHEGSPESQIVVITNDNDYLQMKKENIHLYNLQGKGTDLTTRSKGSPEVDLYMKICIGDPSDNIQPICEKLGKVTAEKLARMTDEEREAWVTAKGPACREAYERNKRLVSFSAIPDDLIQNVNDKYNCVFE